MLLREEGNRGEGTGHRVGSEKVFVRMCCRESLAAWLVAWLGVRHGVPRWLGVAQLSGIAGRVEEGQNGNGLNCQCASRCFGEIVVCCFAVLLNASCFG